MNRPASFEYVRRSLRAVAVFVVSLLGVAASSGAAGTCHLKAYELAVTMSGSRPLVHAKINGTDALFIADSGAFYSSLTTAAARRFNLSLEPLGPNFTVQGVGGSSQAWVTRVKTFTLLNADIQRVEFLVLPNDLGEGTVGVLGQNIFRIEGDVEYDLANGMIRLIRTDGCRKTDLAYWAAADNKMVSVMDIEYASASRPHTVGVAYLNGAKISVMFDTGASSSVLSLDAAKHAGITPTSPDVTPAGYSYGIGRHVHESFIGRFATFRIGDNEEIKNARLRFADLPLDVDMLIGADFFLSHRIYVATSQGKLYLTYNGGPVFDLRHEGSAAPTATADQHASAAPPDTVAGTTPPTESQDPGRPPATNGAQSEEPKSAAAFARRGNASASRHDYQHAIADLTRACQQEPTNPEFLRERGMAYLENRQADLALKDFESAIALRPEDPDARLARASLRLSRNAPAADVAADLEVADRVLPKQHPARLTMGGMFAAIGDFSTSVSQYDQWIDSHDSNDIAMGEALNGRCLTRALWGRELQQALSDCNSALKLSKRDPGFLDSRGLVYLRLEQYEKAIADYDAALAQDQRIAWSLYGRGIARLRKGQTAQGESDMAAAQAIDGNITEHAKQYGIQP
ncbi:MAG: aspartyl protease family protein [Proteobacteria bacterium]|nr:aspartyl protease family protein [Pseudomonadota bacterium]